MIILLASLLDSNMIIVSNIYVPIIQQLWAGCTSDAQLHSVLESWAGSNTNELDRRANQFYTDQEPNIENSQIGNLIQTQLTPLARERCYMRTTSLHHDLDSKPGTIMLIVEGL